MQGGVDGRIEVNFAGLEQGADNIARSAKMIEDRLTQLKGDIGKLVASWTGEAAETYGVHQKAWDESAAQLQQVLASIGTAVRQAGIDYKDGERNNANRWT